jgi:hypothetical protein
MSVVASCLALALALSAGACGRIGFELAEADADPNAPVVDAGRAGVGDGGSLQCEGNPGSNCVSTTISIGIGGTTTIGDNLQSYAVPLIPACGAGPIAEGRTRLLAPSVPAIATIEIAAETDILLSILADDCDGATLSCTVISANSNGSVQIATLPNEAFLISAASNDSCGDITLTIQAEAQSSADSI